MVRAMIAALVALAGLFMGHTAQADHHFNPDSWVETKCVERGEVCNFRVSPWDVPEVEDVIWLAVRDIPVSPVRREDFYDFETAQALWMTFSLEDILQNEVNAITASIRANSQCVSRSKKETCLVYMTERAPQIPRDDPRFEGWSDWAVERVLTSWPGLFVSEAYAHLFEMDQKYSDGYYDYRRKWPDRGVLTLSDDFIPADVLEREFGDHPDLDLIKRGHDIDRLLVHWIYHYDRYLIYRHYYGWAYNAIPAGPACDDLYDPLFDTGCNDKPDWRNDDLRKFEAIVDAYNTMPNDLMRKLSLRWRNTKPYDGPLIEE